MVCFSITRWQAHVRVLTGNQESRCSVFTHEKFFSSSNVFLFVYVRQSHCVKNSLFFIFIIIIIYFENVHFLHAKLGLDICPYEVPPHIPEYCSFRLCTKHLHVIIQTFFPRLSALTATPHPCHLPISTGKHPIISTPNAPDAQTILICHASPHPPTSVYLKPDKSTFRFLSFSDTPD